MRKQNRHLYVFCVEYRIAPLKTNQQHIIVVAQYFKIMRVE